MNAREKALNIIENVFDNSAYINISLANAFASEHFNSQDKALLTELVYGTVDKKNTIDYFIRKYSSVPIRKMSSIVLNVIRISLYQLLFIEKIPESAICNEAVKIVKKYQPRYANFTNGVLRTLTREKVNLKIPAYNKKSFHSYDQYLSILFSFPEWLITRFVGQYGYEFTETMLVAFSKKSDFTIRTNTLMQSREVLINELNELGFVATATQLSDSGIIIDKAAGIFETDLFKNGAFYVQDEGAMLLTELIGLCDKNCLEILDVCAAPGGKATHIAEILKDNCNILCCDIYENKIKIIEQNCERLGINSVETCVQDATQFIQEFVEKFDLIIADVPCSGTGIISRKPEIKWKIKEQDFESLNVVQQSILNNVKKYLKIGGTLIYSTCSIDKTENEKNVLKLIETGEFECDKLKEDIFKRITFDAENIEKCGVTIFPHLNSCDGFYVAKLNKLN